MPPAGARAPTLLLVPTSPSELLAVAFDAAHQLNASAAEEDEGSKGEVLIVVAGSCRRDFSASLAEEDEAVSTLEPPHGQRVRILFAPTVAHLRALLAALPSRTGRQSPLSLLVLYGLVRAHRATSEWTARGLAATAAAAADADRAFPTVHTVLVEPRTAPHASELEHGTADIAAPGSWLLAENLPLLLGTGDGGTGDGPPLPPVTIGRVLGRWFQLGDVVKHSSGL